MSNEILIVRIDCGIVDSFNGIEVSLCEVDGRVSAHNVLTGYKRRKCKKASKFMQSESHGEAGVSLGTTLSEKRKKLNWSKRESLLETRMNDIAPRGKDGQMTLARIHVKSHRSFK